METKLELTDPIEIEDFKDFCKFKQYSMAENEAWKQVKTFAKNIGYGNISLVIQDGLPIRIDNAIQKVNIQIRI